MVRCAGGFPRHLSLLGVTMNCKKGDLAIIVSSSCGNEGKIVQCLELLITGSFPDTKGGWQWHVKGVHPVWRIDRPINFANAFDTVQVMYCSDTRLRPLRGDLNGDDIESTTEKKNELETIA
jgi:hypothetical protein